MKSLSIFLKKMSDGQSDMQITIKYVFIFLQIINRSHKIGVRLNKTLKLKFMLIYVVYVKYTIYPYLSGGNIIQMVLGLIWPLYPMAYKTWLKNRCISLFDINIRSSLFLKILLFYPVLPTRKFKGYLRYESIFCHKVAHHV